MNTTAVQLRSTLDASVNFVSDHPDGGKVEARYVRRPGDHFIVYVSSQTGCDRACRFCHLTQTGQTAGVNLTVDEIRAQADTVLAHFDTLDEPARRVHFNFMARGEPFDNPHLIDHGDELVDTLNAAALDRGLYPAVKISTIWPTTLGDQALTDIFRRTQPDIYYSLYSTSNEFRRRWLPRAADHRAALAALAAWQDDTQKIPYLHWALIAGENDADADIDAICAAVTDANLRVNINLVAYNPPSDRQGRESDRAPQVADRLRRGLPDATIQQIPRVGFDVAASCGMFVGGRPRR